MSDRWDETWHRLREWTNGQGASERLAAQIVLASGFTELDPSHPLGGPDGGKDALCKRDGQSWAMAVYFPRSQQDVRSIEAKFRDDAARAKENGVAGIVFVTNQELRLSERKAFVSIAADIDVELIHLERLTAILDQPSMATVRRQFLSLGPAGPTSSETDELSSGVDSIISTFLDELLLFEETEPSVGRNPPSAAEIERDTRYRKAALTFKSRVRALNKKYAPVVARSWQPLCQALENLALGARKAGIDAESRDRAWERCRATLRGILDRDVFAMTVRDIAQDVQDASDVVCGEVGHSVALRGVSRQR